MGAAAGCTIWPCTRPIAGRGIAASLVREVEQRLKARGCLKVNLLIFRDNDAARALYERLGYTVMEPLMAMGKEL